MCAQKTLFLSHNSNKNHLLLKAIHITLIFSLLTSSVGMVVNRHFCRNELKRTAIFVKAASCHAADAKTPLNCPHHQEKKGLDKQDCCNNTSYFFKTSQEQQFEFTGMPVLHFPAALSPCLAEMDRPLSATVALSGKYYRPPPLMADLSITFQVFRL